MKSITVLPAKKNELGLVKQYEFLKEKDSYHRTERVQLKLKY